MDRDKVRNLRVALNRVLKEFGAQENLNVVLGNASYTDSSADFKLHVNEIAADGQVLTREAETFKRTAHYYGLQPEDLGRTFRSHSGKTFKITGLNRRAHKYPIQAVEVGTGKRFKFPPRAIIGNFIEAA